MSDFFVDGQDEKRAKLERQQFEISLRRAAAEVVELTHTAVTQCLEIEGEIATKKDAKFSAFRKEHFLCIETFSYKGILKTPHEVVACLQTECIMVIDPMYLTGTQSSQTVSNGSICPDLALLGKEANRQICKQL